MAFQIFDWAGNLCCQGKRFRTFEDAWDYVYRQFEHLESKELEEELQEYFVEKVK